MVNYDKKQDENHKIWYGSEADEQLDMWPGKDEENIKQEMFVMITVMLCLTVAAGIVLYVLI